jgi:hypothetical protein
MIFLEVTWLIIVVVDHKAGLWLLVLPLNRFPPALSSWGPRSAGSVSVPVLEVIQGWWAVCYLMNFLFRSWQSGYRYVHTHVHRAGRLSTYTLFPSCELRFWTIGHWQWLRTQRLWRWVSLPLMVICPFNSFYQSLTPAQSEAWSHSPS